MKPFKRGFGAIIVLSLSLLACTHPLTTLKQKETVMPTTSHPDTPNEVITAEQASLRFLKLMDSIKSIDDLTPELIQQVTGLKPIQRPDDPNNFYFGARLSKDWYYGYSLFFNIVLKQQTLNFSFGPADVKGPRPDMTDVCAIDLEDYHERLLAMGFEHVSSVRYGRPGRQYRRGDLYLRVAYAGESTENAVHDCVIRIDVR